ncbi:MAG: hypothetical protein JOZ94_06720 [Xanthobacteraceae bacterium]|nr:hypothetical protein [Xanthobacteraceae bacterium]MBV9628297.1 hypothetical protein [Xanthobacteraceae bacterium]
MEKRAPTTLTFPHSGAVLRHARTNTYLGDLPDIEIFFCAACSHVEIAQRERAA